MGRASVAAVGSPSTPPADAGFEPSGSDGPSYSGCGSVMLHAECIQTASDTVIATSGALPHQECARRALPAHTFTAAVVAASADGSWITCRGRR